MVKGAVATKQRDVRMLELTASELKQLGPGTKVYDGIGKMYVSSKALRSPCWRSTSYSCGRKVLLGLIIMNPIGFS